MKTGSLLAALVLFFRIPLAAAEPEVSARLNTDTIGLQEQAVLVIECDRPADSVIPPDTGASGPPFEIASAGESRQSQVTIVNGVMQTRNTVSYTFVLTPRRLGTFETGSFTVVIGGKKYQTRSLRLDVVKASRKPRTNPGDPFAEIDEFFHSRSKIPVIRFRLAPRAPRAPGNKFLQNQQVILDGTIESPDAESFRYEYKEIEPIRSDKSVLFDITSSLTAADQKTVRISRENVYRKLAKRYVIYPVETGIIGVLPPKIVSITPYGQILLKTDAIGVESVAAPGNSGLTYVGDLTVRRTISETNSETGKSVTLELEMTGDGNLKILAHLYGTVALKNLFFAPPDTSIAFTGLSGERAVFRQRVRYLVTASRPGVYRIPPVTVRYSDRSGAARTLTIEGFTYTATGALTENSLQKTFVLKSATPPRDFRFLAARVPFVLAVLLFVLLPVAAFLYGRHRDRLATEPEYARSFTTRDRFFSALSESRQALQSGDGRRFHSTLLRAVQNFLADQYRLPAGATHRMILEEIRKKERAGTVAALYDKLYEECVRKAYGNSGNSAGQGDDLLKAAETIARHFQ